MARRMNRIPVITGFILAAAASNPGRAADAPLKSGGMSVLLEVRARDDKQEQPPPLEVVLTLIAPHGCAEASERRPDAEYDFKVCSEGDAAGAPALSFHLERTRNLPEGSERRQFKVKAALAPGKTLVIARFVEGAREMEVKAMMKRN